MCCSNTLTASMMHFTVPDAWAYDKYSGRKEKRKEGGREKEEKVWLLF